MLRRARGLMSLAMVLGLAAPCQAADSKPIEVIVVTAAARPDVQSIDASQIVPATSFTVADTLQRALPSAILSDTESNPFQPDLYFRGFDASPVLGTPEGLAIYQGGTRINQAFGGTVLWDLVPTFAIAHIDVVPGSDPIFGLNALGGAVAIRMKTGFDSAASDVALSGGSFDRIRLVGETAGTDGADAFYAGASFVHDGGWRRSSASDQLQAYGDYAMRKGAGETDISLTVAEDWLNENAAIPVQDDPAAAFSIPDTARDRLVFLQARGAYDWNARIAIRGAAYVRWTQVYTTNGQASGFSGCTSDPTLLCSEDDTVDPLSTTGGGPIAASAGGNGSIGIQTTETKAFGATAEIDVSTPVAGFDNALTAGATADYAPSDFKSSTALANLTFQPGGDTARPLGILVGGDVFNVDLGTTNTDTGLYLQDTLGITSSLSLALAGRFNYDRVDLSDRLGSGLSGDHAYSAVNPSAQLNWLVARGTQVYARFGQSSRTPTAAELSCADPTRPCLFPLSFISDPGLRQVFARTVETGATGHSRWGDASLDWTADLYDTRTQDDILFVSSGSTIGAGYFSNVGATQRRGADVALAAQWRSLDARISYAYVDATFRSAFSIQSAFNPGADTNGNILVRPGDRLPSIPRHVGKIGLGYQATGALHFDVDARLASSQFLRGDEANLERPLSGYIVLDAQAEYTLSDRLIVYVAGENILDARYATFGLYGDPTGGGALPQFTNPRFVVPAAPLAVTLGVRSTF